MDTQGEGAYFCLPPGGCLEVSGDNFGGHAWGLGWEMLLASSREGDVRRCRGCCWRGQQENQYQCRAEPFWSQRLKETSASSNFWCPLKLCAQGRCLAILARLTLVLAVLLNLPQCTWQPPKPRIIRPQVAVSVSLTDTDLKCCRDVPYGRAERIK